MNKSSTIVPKVNKQDNSIISSNDAHQTINLEQQVEPYLVLKYF